MILKLYIDSDNLIRWDKLVNAADGSYANAATMTFTLKTVAGVAVSGASAVSMPYVGNSNGRYQGILESSVSLAVGYRYYLEVTVAQSGVNGFRRIQCIAQYRGDN